MTAAPAISQNRMITFVSGQPTNSKWWWIGESRNRRRRRPDARNTSICKPTEPASTTLIAQMSSRRRWVLVVSASSASAAPIASAPTSPMKICAGAAFHHKNPTLAPANAAASTARSNGLTMSP